MKTRIASLPANRRPAAAAGRARAGAFDGRPASATPTKADHHVARLAKATVALISLAAASFLLAASIVPAQASAAPKAVLGTFGFPNGEDGGQLTQARSVAANVSGNGAPAGSVYVAEGSTNHRISQFDADGNFIRLWGYDVIEAGKPNDNGTGFEICDVTNGNVAADCKEGDEGNGAGQLFNPQGIAVDQTNGFLYSTSPNNRRVDVFAPSGEFAGAFGWGVDTGAEALEICTTLSGCQVAAAAGGGAGNFQNLGGSIPAIDPSAAPGTLYVPDMGNARVAQYATTIIGGVLTSVSFTRAFGWDVDPAGGTELETCTSISGCKAGSPGNGPGQFGPTSSGSPTAAAVDSTGAIYVVSGRIFGVGGECSTEYPCRIQKFPSSLASAADFGPTSGPGQVLFTSGLSKAVAALAVAIDPSNDHVFVLRRESETTYKIVELDSSGAYVDTHPGGEALPGVSNNLGPGLTVGTGGRVYSNLGAQPFSEVFILFDIPSPPTPEIDPVTEVSTDGATFHGSVEVATEGSQGFETSWRFEYSANGTQWVSAPVPDVAVGSTPGTYTAEQSVSGLQPSTEYVVRLAASTTAGTTRSELAEFTTGALAPRVALSYVEEVTQSGARVGAHVDPQGLKTTYHFEWDTEAAWEASGEYGNRVPAFERNIGAGNSAIIAEETIAGLDPATTYRYRVVATNSEGTVEGPDKPFETLNGCGFTDNRCLELVSPADKGPVGSATENVATSAEPQFQAAPAGSAIQYQMAYGTPDATAGNEVIYKAEREAASWASSQVAPPMIAVGNTGSTAYPSRTLGLSEDLSCGIYNSNQPLVEGGPTKMLDAGFSLLYKGTGEGAFELITDLDPDVIGTTATEYPDGPYALVGLSEGPGPDCERVILRTSMQYPGVAGAGTLRLYEWEQGALRNVGAVPGPSGLEAAGVIPGSTEKPGVAPGDQGPTGFANISNAVSKDASRVVFTAISKLGGDLGREAVFVRDRAAGSGALSAGSAAVTGVEPEVGEFAVGQQISGPGIAPGTTIAGVEESGGEVGGLELSQAAEASGAGVELEALRVLDASQSQTGTANDGISRYELASEDGGEIFFTARYGLAANGSSSGAGSCQVVISKANGPGCDLYRYSVASGELSAVSVAEPGTANPGGAGAVGVLAGSEDGHYVYFAARGQLVADEGPSEAENLAADTYSVYRADVEAAELQHVGEIRAGSAADNTLTATSGGKALWSSQATPDGRQLLFASQTDLTEYEQGGRIQAYLYDSESEELACVSCRRDQQASASPLGFSPIATGPLGSSNRWHPPLRLAGEGEAARVFFASYDPLATGGVEGRINLYQWEGGQISFLGSSEISGSGTTRLAGASASGDDVYFTTFDRLTWQDTDAKLDVYDVRVGGGFAQPPAPPAPCDPLSEGSCANGPSSGPGVTGVPPSAVLSGAGNLEQAGSSAPCSRFGRQAKSLSGRAARLARNARRVNRGDHRRAVRMNRSARRLAKRARQISKRAKRCRGANREADTNGRAGK